MLSDGDSECLRYLARPSAAVSVCRQTNGIDDAWARMIALIHSLHNFKQLFVNEQAINACLSRNHIYEVEFIIDFLPLIDGRYTQLCCWVTPYILYTVSGVT